MARHIGGSPAQSGYYWNARAWSITPIPREGGFLPGGPGDRYLKVPTLAVLMLMPILGGLFVVFLPVIGFVLVAYALGKKVAALVRGGAASTPTRTGTFRVYYRDIDHVSSTFDNAP